MKGVEFPLVKTKFGKQSFKLEDPAERRRYFDLKVGKEIKEINQFLKKNTFVGILLGKKNTGKGTYSKLFMEALSTNKVAHISVGDIVRDAHKQLSNKAGKKELTDFLKNRYRGFIAIEKALDVITGRDTETLLPTEVILALVEKEISRHQRKAVFIDGFPRNLDQVSYSLYFRSIMGYRDDPDFFVFIDVPETIIDERIKNRVICPKCHTPRSLKLLRTKEIGYDAEKKKFFLKCDDPKCRGERMVAKEGDELGIEAIRNRIEIDDKVMRMLMDLQGVPKVFLRNSVPTVSAKKVVDDYEITPAYGYEIKNGIINVTEESWVVKDDNGVDSNSLLPAAVVVSMIKQIAKVLGL